MIALVRHADAGKRGGGDRDHLRPLTERGLTQAAALVGQLETLRISSVLSSPYLRCRQTVEPLASARGLPPVELDLLAEGHTVDELMPLLVELAPTGAALCSHGDVIGGVVGSLVESGVVRRDEARFAKGSTWLLDIVDGVVISALYLPPR